MQLTPEQQAILDGSRGEVVAKVMKSLVMFGETFGAEKLVPITGDFGHMVISFGIGVMKPVYDLMDQLIEAGALPQQQFTVDPKPLDPNIPTNLLQDVVFKVIMYSQQKRYDEQLKKLGLMKSDAYTCTCYMDEVGNKPKMGDVLSWSESSAVVYANSVLGARCNRNSGIFDLFGAIVGYVPYFGLLTDEGRKATWIVDVQTTKKPEAQILGSAIGMKVMEEVPYVRGLDKFLGTELNNDVCDYLKDFGAATASNGAVGLYHIDKLTPEAVEQGESLIAENAQIYVIDDAELERIVAGYPCVWKDPDARPKLCFMGCPHMSLNQLKDWTHRIQSGLQKAGNQKVVIPTVFTTSPAVKAEFEKTTEAIVLKNSGVILSDICPLMYMNNPLCGKMPVITSSNKLRTYTTAKFYSDDEILAQITKGGNC
ncbi:MAG: aconitase X [Eubacteriales bacterium]|nr:aconitase X [Eubacteriales bacterium]